MGGNGPNNGGRVTTRELYDALKEMDKDQSTERRAMETRIMSKIDCIPVLKNQVDTNKDEIKQLRRRSDIIDTMEGLFGVAVAIFLGTRE
jgi:hypothetical protein